MVQLFSLGVYRAILSWIHSTNKCTFSDLSLAFFQALTIIIIVQIKGREDIFLDVYRENSIGLYLTLDLSVTHRNRTIVEIFSCTIQVTCCL